MFGLEGARALERPPHGFLTLGVAGGKATNLGRYTLVLMMLKSLE